MQVWQCTVTGCGVLYEMPAAIRDKYEEKNNVFVVDEGQIIQTRLRMAV